MKASNPFLLASFVLTLVTVPAIALADKDLDAGDNVTYDCGEDGIVNINHDGGSYTLTGECSEVNLNGSNASVTIENVDQLAINGAGNRATAAKIATILVHGDKNTVRWRKA